MPYLQMQDAAGQWITVNQDMGMPSGKPKTIAVDLRFPSSSRKLRIVTSLCVYWDEIFLSEGPSAAAERPAALPLDSADLHFRGFSEARIDAERKQPDTYLLRNRVANFVLESHARHIHTLRRRARACCSRRTTAW